MLLATTITLSIGWLAGVVIYAVLATGLALAIFCGASRDIDKMARDNAQLREDIRKNQTALENIKAVVETQGVDLDISHDHLNARENILQTKLDEAKGKTRYMAKMYVAVQNEYAWYRTLVRKEFPEAHLLAETRIQTAKDAAAELKRVINPEVMNG